MPPPLPALPYAHIAIEGPIGAGKTSLANLLSERGAHRTLLERPEDNPFLERFYRDNARYALPTQLHFYLQRVEQAKEIAALKAANTAFVTDFIMQKSDIFSRVTLPEDELQLYRALVPHVSHVDHAPPDLIVYLQASPDILLARIQKRARPPEWFISEAYLRALNDAYNEFFYHYNESPVLTVNTEHLNPLESSADFALLIERIETMRGPKSFFSKGA
jgi:deoxyadenosine/deoxycytidine kinase